MAFLYEFVVDERYKDKNGAAILVKRVQNVDSFDNRQYVWYDEINRKNKEYLNIFLSDSEYAWGLEKMK